MIKRVYDGKLLFQTYCGWGAAATNNKLVEFAKKTYGRSSPMGPYYAMWHWAFRNAEEAYEIWKKWMNDVEMSNPRYIEEYPPPQPPPPPTWEEFLVILRDKALSAPSIGGNRSRIERFCAKYGVPMSFRVNKGDVVQVVRTNHPLFQSLLVVDNVETDRVDAHYFAPDRNTYEPGNRSTIACQVSVRDIGVIGKAIV